MIPEKWKPAFRKEHPLAENPNTMTLAGAKTVGGALIRTLRHARQCRGDRRSAWHGSADGCTIVDRRGDQIQGLVAGLYVSPDLMGVATHGGERTHAHWEAPDLG